MKNSFKNMLLRNDVQEHPLLQSIRDVCQRLEALESCFSMQQDADLIEACIYEQEALRAQYRFLLRQAKQAGITGQFAAPFWEERL